MVKLCKAVILNFHKESPIRLKPKAEIHGTETHTAVSTFHHLYNRLRGQSEFQHLTFVIHGFFCSPFNGVAILQWRQRTCLCWTENELGKPSLLLFSSWAGRTGHIVPRGRKVLMSTVSQATPQVQFILTTFPQFRWCKRAPVRPATWQQFPQRPEQVSHSWTVMEEVQVCLHACRSLQPLEEYIHLHVASPLLLRSSHSCAHTLYGSAHLSCWHSCGYEGKNSAPSALFFFTQLYKNTPSFDAKSSESRKHSLAETWAKRLTCVGSAVWYINHLALIRWTTFPSKEYFTVSK